MLKPIRIAGGVALFPLFLGWLAMAAVQALRAKLPRRARRAAAVTIKQSATVEYGDRKWRAQWRAPNKRRLSGKERPF